MPNDPGEKVFDPTVQSNSSKELLEQLMFSLQNSMGDVLSGDVFGTKVDVLSNALFSMTAYAESLKSAIQDILAVPVDNDDELVSILDIAEVVIEGASRANDYVEILRKFGLDLSNIQSELYSKLHSIEGN
jgi:CBS domain-containing protein